MLPAVSFVLLEDIDIITLEKVHIDFGPIVDIIFTLLFKCGPRQSEVLKLLVIDFQNSAIQN